MFKYQLKIKHLSVFYNTSFVNLFIPDEIIYCHFLSSQLLGTRDGIMYCLLLFVQTTNENKW